MKFCPICNNMYYIKTDKADKQHIVYWCKNCTHEEKNELKDNNCIYSANYTTDHIISYKDYINKYTHLDPTLPRVNNIPCPNKDCVSNHGKDKEVIYIKYDNHNMKYLYLCVQCQTCWKNDLDSMKYINI